MFWDFAAAPQQWVERQLLSKAGFRPLSILTVRRAQDGDYEIVLGLASHYRKRGKRRGWLTRNA